MRIFAARHLLPIAAPPVDDGALLIEDSRILAVGTRRELAAAHPRAAVVDCGEAVILPPLVNAHTHLELTCFPDWVELAGAAPPPDGFVDWILHLVQVRRTVGDLAVRSSLFEGLCRSLAAGTGAVGDILTTLAARPAYRQCRMRGRVFAEVLGVDGARVAARLEEIGRHLRCAPDPGLGWGLSPHAPYTLTEATLAGTLDFAAANRLPVAMHWGETAEEVDFLTRGCGPLAERLYPTAGWPLPSAPAGFCGQALAGLPAGSLLVHGVHATDETIGAIAASGLGVVLCPRSNSRFGAARAPVAAYHRAGVPLALGTDSMASSPSLSVWEELAFARHWFAGALEPAAWLEVATAGGAAALGLGGVLGRLAPGLEASFQVVALPAGSAAPTLAEALCAGGREIAVQALFLAGENVLPPCRSPHIMKNSVLADSFPPTE